LQLLYHFLLLAEISESKYLPELRLAVEEQVREVKVNSSADLSALAVDFNDFVNVLCDVVRCFKYFS
jgi:hypothetical protein